MTKQQIVERLHELLEEADQEELELILLFTQRYLQH